jgi:hypothetical protein
VTLAALPPGDTTLDFSGKVKNGTVYSHSIDKNMTFELKPYHDGWEIIVRLQSRPKENLAKFTPTLNDFNDRYIQVVDGMVPQSKREFIFSPQVGDTIQGSRSSDPVSEDETERIRHDGHGTLEMTNLKLAKLNGLHPFIDEMNFDVKISYRPR